MGLKDDVKLIIFSQIRDNGLDVFVKTARPKGARHIKMSNTC